MLRFRWLIIGAFVALTVGATFVWTSDSSAGTFPNDRYALNSDGGGTACSDWADQFAGYPRVFPGVCDTGSWLQASPKMLPLNHDRIWDMYFLAGDWNRDGCDDIIGVKGGSLTLINVECAGSGVASVVDMPDDFTDYDNITSVGLWEGDFNPDIVARRKSDSALVLFTGNGSAGFLNDGAVIGSGWDAADIIMGASDLDVDGCPDILVRRIDTHQLRLYRGNCEGGFKGNGDEEVIGGEDCCADFDMMFAGGDWITADGNHCPDIGGWKQSEPDNLYFFAGDCHGNINLPPIVVPRTDGFGYPAVTDSVHRYDWGDLDCQGGAGPVDALKVLRTDAGLSANPVPGCRNMGKKVLVNTDLLLPWGDVDCSGALDPIDAQKLLLSDAGRPAPVTVPDCPAIGGTFNMEWLAQTD